MKKSIILKMFQGFILIVVGLVGFILFFSFQTIRSSYIRTMANDLERINQVTLPLLQPSIFKNTLDHLNEQAKQIARGAGVRITVVDSSGKVLADSEKDPRSMNNHRYRPEIITALTGKTGVAVRFSGTVEKGFLYVATPLYRDQVLVAVVRSSLSVREIQNLLTALIWRICLIAIAALGLMCVITWLFARRLGKPLQQLVTATQRVTDGDFDSKIYLTTHDEFEQLAENFNQMTAELKGLFQNLQIQRDELQTIIKSIQGGLAVVAADGRINLFNEPFRQMCRCGALEKRHYWELVSVPQIIELIKRILAEKTSTIREIEIDEKTYIGSMTYLPTTGEVVLIFSDITELKNIQTLKKDFVVNVSHELRTPLTAIKGFVETLRNDATESNRQYLEIIARHTERLINIVNDLLLLAEIEGKNELVKEAVDLEELVGETIKIFEARLKTKNLAVRIAIEAEARVVELDSYKFQQVLVNLIDNAVKYTDKGTLTISARREGLFTIISVEDTGMGIPAQHLPRIFERFYVVDKSRSRLLGGTGLGLAIAKHIVLMHNGQIEVSSAVGHGTCFTIRLPR